MGLHPITALVLLLSCWNLLFAQEDALAHLFEEQQGGLRDLQAYSVFCGENAMQVVLPAGSHEVNIIGLSGDHPVLKCPDACGCSMLEENRENILEVSYSGCHVIAEGGKYTLRVLYRDGTGQTDVATVSCAAIATQMPSPKPHCLIPGWCSYNTVTKEDDVLSMHQDSVHWMPPVPEMPRSVFGTHLGSVPWMPLESVSGMTLAPESPRDVPGQLLAPVPWMPVGSVPWMPLDSFFWTPQAPEKPVHVPDRWLGSVSSAAVAQKKLEDVPDTALAPESPRHVPGKLLMDSVPWIPLVPEKLRDVPGTTLAPETPRDVPGKPLDSVSWMPPTPEKLRDVPSKLLGFDDWMPPAPDKLQDVPGMTLAPDHWMPPAPENFQDVPDPTLAPETSLDAVPGAPRPPPAAVMTFLASQALRHMYKQGGCSVPASQRLPCLPGATAARCLEEGCCVDATFSTCYYPMNECTADGHFVFAVTSNITSNPLNLAGLTVAGKGACRPVIANEDVAVFKFRVTECGTHSYQIGLTTIYFAEVQSALRTLNLKYGIITRDEFFRLIVECRYSNFSSSDVEGRVFTSAGYMVINPSLPALVRAKGLFGVQLRIAEDKTFTSFLPHYHQPLRKLLGKPVYLEVRLNSPKPEATLLVHYCVAYPRSASSALVLLYDGCPNPFDSDILILHVADAPQSHHKRRFEVKAFEFVNQSTNKHLDEEIYFMCSTEVCMPSEAPCKETCFEES